MNFSEAQSHRVRSYREKRSSRINFTLQITSNVIRSERNDILEGSFENYRIKFDGCIKQPALIRHTKKMPARLFVINKVYIKRKLYNVAPFNVRKDRAK